MASNSWHRPVSPNLFPAVLIAGPPHSGKSVLAFLLSQHLQEMGIAHYLLRTAPDGEGNWFQVGDPEVVRELRLRHKGEYTPEHILTMRTALVDRRLPLLVDIGGRPQGAQLSLLNVCTHAILLYRSPEERRTWRELLNPLGLILIAELRSRLEGEEQIIQLYPVLKGSICHLEREARQRRVGVLFGALLDRVGGVFRYEEQQLAAQHLGAAPLPPLTERALGRALGVPAQGQRLVWQVEHLARLAALVPRGKPFALYGRGPVWLAAWLAVRALPAPFALFDVRYGWVVTPEVRFQPEGSIQVEITPLAAMGADWADLKLPSGHLEPGTITIPAIEGRGGLILSGRLPRWGYAALARKLASQREWVAIHDANMNKGVIIHSRSPKFPPATTVKLPAER